ncbi:MAG: ATP-binding cassette domain-containing protein [Bacteroidales bacterium]|nr:ATP-binding cassette domain-containing protein [Bacteroidales bacterium]MCF8389458.1 ATP-binding cassette domain-containing protein [Bacteroidales bacterium]
MISIDNITVHFGGFVLLDKVSLQIGNKDRVGLVGRNGAGKTTLMRIISGLQEANDGKVIKSASSDIGYLPQQMIHMEGKSVIDEAKMAFKDLLLLEKKIETTSHLLATREDYESDSYLNLINELTELNAKFELGGGNAIHGDIEKTLLGLGFMHRDFDRPTSEFSGGWRMRIELAKLLLKKPAFLLLDEPTNHLDIESIQWLEDYLKTYAGGVILISHDRAFLDNVTNRTVEISLGGLTDYKVPYSRFVVLRKERREQEIASYQNQQKLIKETEDFIERFRYKATKAVQVQSRVKQLNKLVRIEVEEEDKATMSIKFPPAPRSGREVVSALKLSKNYGSHNVLDNIDFLIEKGEKVAFVGKNGEGKTTLSKIIAQEISYEGQLKIGHNVNMGYFAQNQDELMDGNKTVLETIDAVAVGDVRAKMRDILGAFLFSGEDTDKKVKVLSGGERSRLSLAKMLLQTHNLLLLDEPTNHLDMRSKDILKLALKKFDGTLIVVSHDREFLDGLIDKVYEFKDHKIKVHLGGIYDFLKKRKLESLQELERKSVAKVISENEQSKPQNKNNYIQKKEYEKKLRKLQNRIKDSENRIFELEEELTELSQKMGETEIHDPEIYKKYGSLESELAKQMEEWEKASDKLSKFEEQSF